MRQVIPRGPVIGLVGALALLAVLHWAVGLSVAGWVVGTACGAALTLTLASALLSRGQPSLGPADRVTLTRAVLACGVAALAADGFVRPTPVALFVTLSATALALDAVDGRVARQTGTASPLGARFDMEADAFLILVLSVHVSRDVGWWVLAAGVARYALVVATWCATWLRRQVPPRRWRKAVAAAQGVVLTAAAAQVLDHAFATTMLLLALALLASSFGTQVWSLWRLRSVRITSVARTLSPSSAGVERRSDRRRLAGAPPLTIARTEGIP